MSDTFALSFRAVNNREEAMDLGVRFARMIAESPYAEQLINNNIRYVSILTKDGDAKTLQGWLRGLFSVRLLYWPEHHLAAIVGDAWPVECMAAFGLNAHTFQDNTDQDDPLESWPDDILFFREQRLAVKHTPFPEYEPGDEEYQRRTVLYNNIFHDLALSDWVDEKETDDFEQMAFFGIYHQSRLIVLTAKARASLKKWDEAMQRLMKDSR